MAGSFVTGGITEVLGYQLVFNAGNPAAYYSLKHFGYGNEPTVPYRFADVILAVRDYPEVGDVMQVRYAKIRTPTVQLPSVTEWIGAGYPIEVWINWFYQGVQWQLWA